MSEQEYVRLRKIMAGDFVWHLVSINVKIVWTECYANPGIQFKCPLK